MALKTVSRVVNGEPGVRPQVVDRVHHAIAELGYRRNDGARLLRKGQTASVGLVLEDIGDPFYSTLSRAVEDVAHQHESLLLTGSSDEDPERERELTLAFCARRVDGLIIIPASENHAYLLPEMAAGLAAVFVDRPPGLIEADTVLSDNRRGAPRGRGPPARQGPPADRLPRRRAADLHRGPPPRGLPGRHGRRRGQPVDPSWVTMTPLDRETVAQALARMTGGPAPVTALFCGNNRATALALRELRTSGRRLALVPGSTTSSFGRPW